ncbi:carbohydrate porin [Acinetobacter baumannii]|nr:carbohydrate porin [Acinetobacter baumannii]
MNKTLLMICMSGGVFNTVAWANDQPLDIKSRHISNDYLEAKNTLNQRPGNEPFNSNFPVGPRNANPESSSPVKGKKLFTDQGQWLTDHGILPRMGLTQLYFNNPSSGIDTNRSESLTMISVGADFELEKIIGLQGGYVHFEELFVPWTHNLSYGNQVGSLIAGKPNPYIPKKTHLTLFTYEQKLLDNKLSIEVGKNNLSNYMTVPICNTGFTCVNSILIESAGLNPPPYANWSARVAYDINPKLRVQAGWVKSNNAYPFTNGWERDEGKAREYGGSLSDVYVADVAYKTNFKMEKYPLTLEAFGFYNNRDQVNPLNAETSNAAKGIYLAGKKVFWRADGDQGSNSNPKALAAYSAVTRNFGENVTIGVGTQVNAGLILSHPFESRPFDSYSVSFIWDQLTKSEQRYLQQSYTGTDGFKPSRSEKAFALDANFILTDSIVFSPYIMRTFDDTTWMVPTSSAKPKSGIAFGAVFHIQLDTLLGLNPKSHP